MLAVIAVVLIQARADGQGEILTPAPPATPRINGARVYGERPGRPFLFTVPVTGDRPMRFGADNLPDGLKLNEENGQITGSVATAGIYPIVLHATNSLGEDHKPLKIVIGDQICLTPPMGWNSWNIWTATVDQDKVLAAAQAMSQLGLVDHGWTYVNIDDAWQGPRGGPFNAVQPNEKFPDIKALSDKIHGMGLKMGIYTTPFTTSYAGYCGGSSDNQDGSWQPLPAGQKSPHLAGKYSFAMQDARQWAAWNIDYLKYDGNLKWMPQIEEMSNALKASGRDIVFSISNSAPIASAASYARLTNAWRTGGDIRDNWKSLSRFYGQDKWAPYAGPGHWNDPDMLVIGHLGWVGSNRLPHLTTLTPDEQYTHISAWCLLSAPLLMGNDLSKMDAFTLNLVTNDEVLALDQDSLGKQAVTVAKTATSIIMAKPLEDGAVAVGLFNIGDSAGPVAITWNQLQLSGKQVVRDLWRQKDLGVFDGDFSTNVATHGVVLVKLTPVK